MKVWVRILLPQPLHTAYPCGRLLSFYDERNTVPTQYNMKESDDLYRAVLEYDHQPFEWQNNPNNPRGPRVRVVTGPVEVVKFCIGPYATTAPIKRFITSNRSHFANLRVNRVEKVAKWEVIDF